MSIGKFKKSDLKFNSNTGVYSYKDWTFFATNVKEATEKAKTIFEELQRRLKGVDPKEHIGVPLWIVYGPDCFPHLLLAKVRSDLTIWGWSIWRRQPGFRTLGMSLYTWIEREENPKFYLNRADAFARLAELIPEVV